MAGWGRVDGVGGEITKTKNSVPCRYIIWHRINSFSGDPSGNVLLRPRRLAKRIQKTEQLSKTKRILLGKRKKKQFFCCQHEKVVTSRFKWTSNLFLQVWCPFNKKYLYFLFCRNTCTLCMYNKNGTDIVA